MVWNTQLKCPTGLKIPKKLRIGNASLELSHRQIEKPVEAGEARPKERASENQSEDLDKSSKAREGDIKEPEVAKG